MVLENKPLPILTDHWVKQNVHIGIVCTAVHELIIGITAFLTKFPPVVLTVFAVIKCMRKI